MKKQYMDFAPARPAKRVVKKKPVVAKVESKVVPRVPRPQPRPQPKKSVVAPQASRQGMPKLGEIEDLSPRYTEADLNKRPLGEKRQPEVTALKAQKVAGRGVAFREKSAKKAEKTALAEDKKTYKTPKSPFINQEKVVKRPLSKNVYRKEIKAPKEEPKGPVTIIEKPEKDAKVGLIVAIILTIILGAAAGTIAFLLIPK